MQFTSVRNDLKHFFVCSGLTLLVIVFYWKYGFYGWPHLLSVIFIQYAVLPLDDWLEKSRTFPWYVLPLLAYSAYYYPLITVLAIGGVILANFRALTGNNTFLLERFEGLGNLPIYVLPYTLPIELHDADFYIAAVLFILFADSFHKIGHRETINPKLMWINGMVLLLLICFVFGKATPLFLILLAALVLSLVPFWLIKSKFHSWVYTQVWICFAGFIGFYYYLSYAT